MKLYETPNQLPIHDIKDYERKNLIYTTKEKREISYVIERMRCSKSDSELFDSRKYIYNENEKNNMKLNKNQISYIKKLASDLKHLGLEYDFTNGIHYVYKFSLGEIFN
ncbi:hypothetical protein [Tenacibaculum finnmarkense]|uniref:hypothetical protein n=1 Tax=Tenacibaculum finnmarkense TaxID=2781243 RepID=UPI001EFB92D6|nr:hypothetical protein [Tenacibaculum finnmarkense]MCG8226392.1 hypothetical protein [Tenacibaculum finnmarkense genomovar finnmarkense]